MTQPVLPPNQPAPAPRRTCLQRLAGPSLPDQFKKGAVFVTLKLGEYWLLTIFISVLILVWFVGFVEDTAGNKHWEYWWSVLTGNYQPAADDVRPKFIKWEYGASLVLALVINITPLVGLVLFIPRYVKMLMQLQERPVKLHALLDMVDGQVKSELLNEFGQSKEVEDKIRLAFSRVKARRPEYVRKVFGQKDGDFTRLLNQELTG
jgi:hypothetical protein